MNRLAGVVIVVMGLSRGQSIADALMAAGRPAGLPVAIVERASLPGERVIPTTLAGLADTLVSQAVRSPAVLVVGEALDVALAAVAEPLQRVGMT